MRSTADPISRLRRRMAFTTVLTVPALAIAVWWAGGASVDGPPTAIARSAPSNSPASVAGPGRSTDSLNADAFTVGLWTPFPDSIPPVVERPARPESIPSITLTLVGILSHTEGDHVIRRAALYDTSTDRTHLVRPGESVGPVYLVTVDAMGVTLEADGRTSKLLLEEEGRP